MAKAQTVQVSGDPSPGRSIPARIHPILRMTSAQGVLLMSRGLWCAACGAVRQGPTFEVATKDRIERRLLEGAAGTPCKLDRCASVPASPIPSCAW